MFENRGIITKPHVNSVTGEVEPVLIENEQKQIYKGKISLTEFPSKSYGIIIQGYTEINEGLPTSTQFKVDYNSNQIWFNTSEEGKTVTIIRYYGEAFVGLDASMIWELNQDGDPVQTLQKIIDDWETNSQQAITDFNTNGNNAITNFDTTADAKLLEIDGLKSQYQTVVDSNLFKKQDNFYTITSEGVTYIPFSAFTGMTWNPLIDDLRINYSGAILVEGRHYDLTDTGINFTTGLLEINTEIMVQVLRGLKQTIPAPSTDGGQILDGSIPESKLASGVQTKIDAVPTLQTDLGTKANLNTIDKTSAVNAINEVNSNTPKKTLADVTYYVATTGSDSNDGLTSGTAFLTITKAVSMIPEVVNHTYTINVASGTYAEVVNIYGYTGKGSIIILGDTVASTTRTVTNISIKFNQCFIKVSGFNISITNADCISVDTCQNVELGNLNIISSATNKSGIGITTSMCHIHHSVISNKYNAIICNKSIVTCDTISGSNNSCGYVGDFGGNIYVVANTLSATTSLFLSVNTGKVHTASSNFIKNTNGYRIYDDGFIEQWGYVNGVTSSGVTINLPITFPNQTGLGVSLIPNTGAVSTVLSYGTVNLSQLYIGSTAGTVSVAWRVLGY